ncbi:LOW QUALITY PROTEIN: procollagen-lysine,2-oxoglutarate 5-dioxygenase 2-like [Ruditapes philippinarum]|uniref:LOW QUALITY PROTEIN: procollagen-lysine,2-oxoglutarate 5-dioxygenase 2-like n=2 Tax=Ruditapes philippinarum TaxID=129788 RepID=UPI00295B1FED|nr:LOW QUALITY PROTEIN: procollagen-lysine,2-oxoglutarate 5-dioxygenase 2-like [Ruditapes philippinarum]
MARILLHLLMLISTTIPSFCFEKDNKELLLVTIATEENDGLRRYIRSTKKYDLETKVFGLGLDWRGGDMTNTGGGHKINILKEELSQYKDRSDLILMFTDSYDVVGHSWSIRDSRKVQQEEDYPSIVLGVFVEHPTPFLREALQKIAALDYPKQKIDFFIHSSLRNHQNEIDLFLNKVGILYKSVNTIGSYDSIGEAAARNWAIEECIKKDCQYFFNVDGDVHLENDQTLKLLIHQNRSVLAPIVTRRGKAWSNFWGALSATGFYARSEDYMDIVHGDKIGLWNVPYLTGVYLVQAHVLPALRNGYDSDSLDADMALCKTLREKGYFMFVTNRKEFGYLINSDGAQTGRLHIELWEIFNNPYDWEKRYIHPNYSHSLAENAVIEQPCPDVFWFPVMTEVFCDEIVAELENVNMWSGGKSEDTRLAGGYENVPTDDVHMTQINLQNQWLEFLRVYVAPLATKVYPGYYSNLPRALLNFVVKYNLERQKELRPHHDSSTFTINIALNTPKLDYEVIIVTTR